MIRIKPEFDEEETGKEFNEYIKEFVDIIEHGKPTTIMGKEYTAIEYKKEEYKDILEIIPSLLMEKTNVADISRRKKYLIEESGVDETIHSLMKDKMDCEDENLYKEFFKKLEDLFNKNIRRYSFILLLNTKFENEILKNYKNEFKEVLNTFELECFNMADLNNFIDPPRPDIITDDEFKVSHMIEPIDIKEIMDLFKDCSELIRIDVDARNLAYAQDEATLRIKSYLGYVSCINEIWRVKEYFGVFDEFNLNNIDYSTILIIIDKKIFWPSHIGVCEDVKHKFEFYNEKVDEELFKNILRVHEEYINEIINISFKNLLNESFSLYHSACVESNLECSFLMFWSLSETLIKWKKDRKDAELVEIMKSFVNPYLGKRIEFIKDKRDDLVHRWEKAKIFPSDRNISKLIADVFLNDAIINMKDLGNKEEYHKYLMKHLNI